MPGQHPDNDVLADLAAEVLPDNEARAVEAHVIGCTRCANLLGDAERVRQLLLADDPGPMPADVWLRIEGALSAEIAQNWSAQDWSDPYPKDAHLVDPYLGTGPIQSVQPLQDAGPAAGDAGETGHGSDAGDPASGRRSARRDDARAYDSGWGHEEWFTQETPAIPAWTPQEEPDLPDAPTSQWSRFAEGDGDEHTDGRHSRTDGTANTYGGAAAAAWNRASDPDNPHHPDDADGHGAEADPDDEGVAASARALARRWRGTADGDPTPASDRVRRTKPVRSRRDVLQDARPAGGFAGRFTRPLAIAAGIVAVAGLGTAVFKVLPLGSSSATSASAGSVASLPETAAGSASAAAAAAPAAGSAAGGAASTAILSTGQNYTAADLVQRALALPAVVSSRTALNSAADAKSETVPAPVASAPAAGSFAASAASGAASLQASPAPRAAPSAVPSAPLAGNTSLTDPAALQSCLTALGVQGNQPLAVDLARYQGRDAAIIVLAARDGGYEVWAVDRTCRPGNGGQLVYKAVPPTK